MMQQQQMICTDKLQMALGLIESIRNSFDVSEQIFLAAVIAVLEMQTYSSC